MRRSCGVLVILILFQICVMQELDPTETRPRIINGTPATSEQGKYMVSVRLKRNETKFGKGHICGGSLFGPKKVLTAAHCFFDTDTRRYREADEFVVVMGTLNLYKRVNGTFESEVSSIVYMKSFDMDTLRDDIGLMLLKKCLDPNRRHLTVQPIALTNKKTPDGATCQVSGWGHTEEASLSDVLLIANVSKIKDSVCLDVYDTEMLPGMFCAGRLASGTATCQGDAGGPLVYNNKLIGIMSWGQGCALPGYPGVYVDVRYYRKWIDCNAATNARSSQSLSVVLGLMFLLCLKSLMC